MRTARIEANGPACEFAAKDGLDAPVLEADFQPLTTRAGHPFGAKVRRRLPGEHSRFAASLR